MTESWFSEESNVATSAIKEAGYEIEHVYRDKRGAGAAIIWKKDLNVQCNFKRKCYDTFQFTNIVLCGSVKINLICLYRLQETFISTFLIELNDLLSHYISKYDTIILAGDFNFHFENSENKDVQDLTNLTSSYGLTQFVVGPSHRLGHTLDLVFANIHEFDLPVINPLDIHISDHFPMFFNLPNFDPPVKSTVKKVQFRNIKSIDRDVFSHNLCDSLNSRFSSTDIENLEFKEHYQIFADCASAELDKLAPLKTKTIPGDSQPDWMDAEYREERALRRRLERTWKDSRVQGDKLAYIAQQKKCAKLVTTKREQYLSDIIGKCENDQRALRNIVNTVLDKRKTTVKLPQCNDHKTLANKFNNFYSNKVQQIRDNIESSNLEKDFRQNFSGLTMQSLMPTTVDELRGILKDMGIKTSSQDPLPGSLCKDIIEDLLPYFCDLVNKSMSTGSMEGIKDCVIIPLLKKSGLDPETLKNYRPVTNEVFISKLSEKVVSIRLFEHMSLNKLHSKFQHGYKVFHGCETLLLKLVNDVLIGFDSNSGTILLLIDLSAAFDTVDIAKLLDILEKDIGITGFALKWFKSFLTGRTQRVKIENSLSDVLPVLYGVPQGSVLGPILFNIYTSSLSHVINNFGFTTSGYADDNNAYQSFPLVFQCNVVMNELPNLLTQIKEWMNLFFLKMNPDKTEIIMLVPQQLKNAHTINGCIFSDGSCIRFANFVKNLGYILDKYLHMDIHVNSIVSLCYKYLSDIGKIRKLLSKKHTEMLVHSAITSRLDYCNSLLYGVNKTVLNKLQMVQNAAARLISLRRKRESVSDVLHNLHWLPVEARIVFKLLLLVYKCLHDMAPDCLVELITVRNSIRSILYLKHYQSSYARRSFSYMAPRLWNNLPDHIRLCTTLTTFKSKVKYLLFNNFNNYMKSVFKYN